MRFRKSRKNHALRNDLDVLCLATQGTGSGDERRIAYLLTSLQPRFLEVDRQRKGRLPLALIREMLRGRPDVIVIEGTGATGGLAVMWARLLCAVPYVVSSGDAVGPFLRAFHPLTWPVAGLYERALYRLCAGFIGWSPYLVGRALSLGAPRGMTAAHFSLSRPAPGARQNVRDQLGIPREAIVIGIVGRILVDARNGYSYGVELIRALRRTTRADLCVLIVGDGDGLPGLVELAGNELGQRVRLPGACRPERVIDYLAAMDIGVLSQSTDLVGSMRYTTKLPEYLAACLPIVTTETPLAYDLDSGWLWRLPGDSPWEDDHVEALANFMDQISREEILEKKARVPQDLEMFNGQTQQQRASAFVRETIVRTHGWLA